MAVRSSNSTSERIGQTVRSLLDRWLSEEELRVYSVCAQWERVVGTQLAERSEPGEFRNGVLLVRTSSGVWAQELQFLKHDILQRLNALVGVPLVRDLLFRQGPVRAKEQAATAAPCRAEKGEQTDLNPPALDLPPISDPVLAEACKRLLQAYALRQREPEPGRLQAEKSPRGGKR